jgi:hypothetical protein
VSAVIAALGDGGLEMTELVRFPLEDGGCVLAEIDRADLSAEAVVLAAAEPGRAVATATQTLESGLRALRPVVGGLVGVLREAGPSGIDVEFGVKLGGETGVILAKGTAEVSFKVTLHWERSADSTDRSDGR